MAVLEECRSVDLHVSSPTCSWEDAYDYICYVPSPRCASTSIKSGLCHSGVLEESHFPDVPGRNGFFVANPVMSWSDTVQWRWWQHFITTPEGSQIARKVDRHDLKLFLWTVVRNPYDRIVSAWQVALREKWLYESCSLEDFISLVLAVQSGNIYTDNFDGVDRPVVARGDELIVMADMTRAGVENAFNHAASLVTTPIFTTDFNRYLREDKAKFCQGVSGVSNMTVNNKTHWITPITPVKYRYLMKFYYLKFESLQSDFNVLCDRLGWPHVELPHHNKIESGNFMSHHTEKTIHLTNILYDFEFSFCYSDERIIC